MPKPSPTTWPADQITRRPVASLTPYARNARVHTPAQIAQIAASIREWGWTMPILVDEAGTVLAGHGRLLAAQHLGLTEVPCMEAKGWSEAQRRAYVLADNRLTDLSTWDQDLLTVEMQDLSALDYNLDLIGWDGEELARLLDSQEEPEPDMPPSSTQEIDPDDYQLGHRCPRCGFEFDDNQA